MVLSSKLLALFKPNKQSPSNKLAEIKAEVQNFLNQSEKERDALYTLHLQGHDIELMTLEALDYESTVLKRTIDLLGKIDGRLATL